MAEAVISVLLETFVSRSLEKIEKEVRLVKNAKKDVAKLKKSLRLIQALLEDAAKKEIESKSVKEWLSGLEEISYDMDDVLDEWNTAIHKSEIQEDQKKVCLPMPSCLSFKENVRLRGFAKKIKELNEELDRIKKEGNDLGIVARAIEPAHHDHQNGTTSVIKHRMTTSFVDEAKVHGRDEEKEALLSMLVSENSSNNKGKRIEIVAIVGFGGLGKTTLAQIVYNHDSVKAHFDTRIWFCVSRPFDLFKIANAIVKELGGNPQSDEELEALMQSISKSIRGKKFLLVLDDVWSEDEATWDPLSQALQSGGIGSKILMTTRNMPVAKMMRVNTNKIVSPRSLSDEQCWSIIRQLTFVEEEECNGFTELVVVGKNISAKCKGSPLIAKILGSHMWLNKSKAKWESILSNKLWELHVGDHIFAPLLLSYYDLSSSEKSCLSYCSVFPEDHIMEPGMLIEMWMSQGYFNDISKGQDCFERLAQRSFFQEFKLNEYNGTIESCKMHDVVYDFVCYLTKGKCLVMKGALIGERFESLDEKTRHLTLLLDAPNQFSYVLECNNERSKIANELRTLVIIGKFETNAKLLSLPCLRTWSNLYTEISSKSEIKFPHNLSQFIHLRYLDISYTISLKELPGSVCDLYNLQTLRMNGCDELEFLPEGIGKLVNLRHLYVDYCNSLTWFPKGMKKLKCLEKLDVLIIPENKETCFNVDDFNELRSLQFRGDLKIKCIRNFESGKEAEKVNLINMEHLHTLYLVFTNSVNEVEATFLEALKPHPNLKKLWIEYYCGSTRSPSWITLLTNLREIHIQRCDFCESLPALGKLPSLESLIIDGMDRVKKVGLELLGITPRNDASFVLFPKLKKLYFLCLMQWQEWEGINIATNSSLKIMPLLETLCILGCHSLVVLPDFLQMIPLEDLFIKSCKSLEEWCRKETGTEWLKNSQIKNVIVDDGYLIQNGIWNNCSEN